MSKAIEISAIIFLICLPIIPWVSYLSLLLLIFWFIQRHNFRQINYYAYALLGAIVLSCIFSVNKLISLGALAIFLCYLLSYIVFANIVDKELTHKKIVTAIILSGIILTGIGVILYFTKFKFVFETEFIKIRLLPQASTLGNPNRFAKYLVLTIPIAFASLLFTKDRVLPFIFMPMAFLGLWITHSLAGMIATFMGLLIILWSKNKWIALAGLVCGLGFYAIEYKKIDKLTYSSSTRVRINTLKYIVPQIFRTYPITGCGIGCYKEVAPKYDKEKRCLHYHTHNMYTHYLCETGILGLSVFLVFLTSFFQRSIKFLTKHNSWLVLGGIASIIGLLIHGIAETCIDYPQIGILFFTLIGIVTGITSHK